MSRCARHASFAEGCFRCKLVGVQFGGAVSEKTAGEQRLGRDLAAYKRLRNDGLQPRSIKHAAELESRASTQREIDMGVIMSRDVIRKHEGEIADGMALARDAGYTTADVKAWKDAATA